jgi:Putative MetA-pathway of phenol degradation
MSVRWKRWLSALAVALGAPAAAPAELVWRPVSQAPPVVASSAPRAPAAPVAALGRPVVAGPEAKSAVIQAAHRTITARGQAPDAAPDASLPPPPPGVQGVFLPGGEKAARVTPAAPVGAARDGDGDLPPLFPSVQHSVAQPPEPPPPEGGSPFAPTEVLPGAVTDRPVQPGFWEKAKGWVTWGDSGSHTGRGKFQSDHCFPALASPVTMPFYFEDPRALTEVRPIFFYQGIPGDTPNFGGGNALFFGTQARVAVTERLSFVFSELGIVSIQPDSPIPPVQSDTGFAELKLGPKYTFLRNSESGTVAAFGVNFEVPVGSSKVFQNTGKLSIDPYLSIGQTFGRLPQGFGSLNVIGNAGYSFSVDDQRSEFLYLNLHLDYNIANANRFYPLIEMNWLHYTKEGSATNLGTEGGDLANLGSMTRQGQDLLRLAGGLRYRFSDNVWAGAAIEFPLTNEKGLADYRVTLDLIFRY